MKICSLACRFATAAAALFAPVTIAEASSYRLVYSFGAPSSGDGAAPVASVIGLGDQLYGTTSNGGAFYNNTTFMGGTVFAVDPARGLERVLHSFGNGADGLNPRARLLTLGGLLYGTTDEGGTSAVPPNQPGAGTVFTVDPQTGAETVVHNFGFGSDGADPQAGLLNLGGVLYGTTASGADQDVGHSVFGTVFAFNPTTGAETVIKSFGETSFLQNGGDLESGLIAVGKLFYGAASEGGPGLSGYGGVLFAVDSTNGNESVLHAFSGGRTDGCDPQGGLIRIGKRLYGTTAAGGKYTHQPRRCDDGGTVFEYDPTTKGYRLLHSFGAAGDGAAPRADLIAVNGLLYGTTSRGGAFAAGCIFTVDPGTGAESVVYSFQGAPDGADPEAGLTDVGGVLYGTTQYGGKAGWGTVFAFTP